MLLEPPASTNPFISAVGQGKDDEGDLDVDDHNDDYDHNDEYDHEEREEHLWRWS